MKTKILLCIFASAILFSACSSKSAVQNEIADSTISKTPKPSVSAAELSDQSKWKKVELNARSYKFSMMVPQSAETKFSPDTSMGTENGVFVGSDVFPYGLIVEYNMLNDRDAKTVTFKADYLKAKPSDIDFGLPNAVMSEGIGQRGIKYTRYLVRKENTLYILSIYTDAQNTNFDVYKNIIKTLKIAQ
jgi:hypothetical protein